MHRPVLIAALFAFFTTTQAIFVDEAFHVDYHQALLGLPLSHATFFARPQSASNASLLYTVSDKAVLAAVNPRDGSLLWRQVLAQEPVRNTTQSYLVADGQGRILSGHERNIIAWDALSGRLLWQQTLPEGWKVVGLQHTTDFNNASADHFAVLASDRSASEYSIWQLATDTGGLQWFHNDASGHTAVGLFALAGRLVYVSKTASLLSGGRTRIVMLDTDGGGSETGKSTLNINPDSVHDNTLICPVTQGAVPLLVSTDLASKTLSFGSLGFGKVMTTQLSDKSDDVQSVSIHQGCDTGSGKSHVLAHVRGKTKNWAEVFEINSKAGTVNKVYALPAIEETSVFAASLAGDVTYFTRIADSEISLYSSESHGQLGRWPRKRPGPTVSSLSSSAHAVAEVVVKGRTGAAVRIAEVSGDGEWSLIRNGETQWTRPEFLANIVVAAWADGIEADSLAEDLVAEISSNALSAYIHRLQRHLGALTRLLQSLPHRTPTSSMFSDSASSSGNSLTGSKSIIVATSNLEIAALNAVEFGSVHWRANLRPVVQAPIEVISLSVRNGRVTVYLSDGGFVVLDLKSGSLIEHKDSGIAPTRIVEIAGSPDSAIVKITADGTPKLALDFSPSTSREGNVLVSLGKDGEATGWSIGQSVTATWTSRPAGAKFIHAVARSPLEPVSSIGRVLGDRRVLYKYLSPNLALLTAISDSSDTLSMHLIDSVTGETLYVSSHPGLDSSAPISSVISENWFVYSFTAKDATTHATASYLVSAELYEAAVPNDRGALKEGRNYSSIAPGSTSKPHVISQSYVISSPISHMSVTQTNQGITSRQLLCTLPDSNAIIGIHRYMIDPRRPVGRDPTALETEEGLIRYQPELVLDPRLYLTHARDVLGIKKLLATPTALESTSLVFAFGHDIFGTRVTPSMAFDVLGKSFNKTQLILTVLALFGGVMLLAPMVRRKQVEGRWRG